MQYVHALGYQPQVLHQPKKQVIEIREQHAVDSMGFIHFTQLKAYKEQHVTASSLKVTNCIPIA